MASTFFVRWGAGAATAAGAAWCGLGLLSLATPEPARYLDALFVAPFALSLGGVVGLPAAQRDRTGRLERAGFGASVAGMVGTLAGQIGIVADLDPLQRLVLPVGLAAWVGGFLLLGIATARGGVLPAWAGAMLALAQPLAVAAGLLLSPISPLSSTGDYTGAIAHGLVWLTLGAALRGRRHAPLRRTAFDAA